MFDPFSGIIDTDADIRIGSVLRNSPDRRIVDDAAWSSTQVNRDNITIGDYAIEGSIGSGGMGVVYRARHRGSGQVVAVKTLRRDHAGSTDMILRLLKEIKASDFHHPNVMPVIDSGESDGQPYLVMPLAEASLSNRMSSYRSPRAAMQLVTKVARGVDAVHRLGFIHRDLKPGNILIDSKGEPKIADFGLVKSIDADESQPLTLSGAALGTAPYMSPEQASGRKQDVGRATDIWSLGVILYELLSGARPFEGATHEATLDRIRRTDPPALRQYVADIDPHCEAIVHTCLEKDPARRYPTAGALADDLDAWLAGQKPWAVRRQSVLTKLHRWYAGIPRGHAAIALTCVLCGFLAMIGSTIPTRGLAIGTARKDEFTTLLDRFQAGQSVDLITEDRPPVWYEWRLTRPQALPLAMAPGGGIRIESPRIELLALAPSVAAPYRVEAVFRLLAASGKIGNGFGVFGGMERSYSGSGRETFFLMEAHSFGRPSGPRLRTTMSSYTLTGAGGQSHLPANHPLPGEFSERADRRVRLSLVVDQNGATGYHEDRPFMVATWTWAQRDMDIAIRATHRKVAAGTRPPSPTGAIGIYICDTSVAVERVTLIPLTNRQPQ